MSQYNNNNSNNPQYQQHFTPQPQPQYPVPQPAYQQPPQNLPMQVTQTRAPVPQYNFETEQQNEYFDEYESFGYKTPGIQVGDKRHGIILGFEPEEKSGHMGVKHLFISCLELGGQTLKVFACKELMKCLHKEQTYNFVTLAYNIGDPIQITYLGANPLKDKNNNNNYNGNSEIKMYAKFMVERIKNYPHNPPDEMFKINRFRDAQLRKQNRNMPPPYQQPQPYVQQQQGYMPQAQPHTYAPQQAYPGIAAPAPSYQPAPAYTPPAPSYQQQQIVQQPPWDTKQAEVIHVAPQQLDDQFGM